MKQNTLSQIGANHPVRALTALAKSIALPGEHAPSRFPSFPALERTAVMSFSQPASLDLPASTAIKMLLMRQASYPLWAEYPQTGASYRAAFMMGTMGGAAATSHCFLTEAVAYVLACGNVTAGNGIVGVSGSSNPAVAYPPIAVDAAVGPVPFLYVPVGYSCTVVVANSNPSGSSPVVNGCSFSVNLDIWRAPGEVSDTTISGSIAAGNVGGAATFTPTENNWIRVRNIGTSFAVATVLGGVTATIVVSAGTHVYTPSVTTCGNVAVTPVATRALLPLVVSSEFANSRLPWCSTRTTAVGVLGTNVSQVLNKGGTVLAGRVSPSVIDPYNVTSSYVSALHPAEKAWLPLETGLYSYCPPSTDLALFWDYTNPTQNSANAIPTSTPVLRLDNDALVNVFFSTAGSVGESLAVTASWHIEFRTSSALFPIAMSALTLESLHQAQLMLAQTGYFFDNPDHRAVLAKLMQYGKKALPFLYGGLRVVSPQLAEAARLAYGALRPVKPPAKPVIMPPTSGARSGIVARKRKAKAARKIKKK